MLNSLDVRLSAGVAGRPAPTNGGVEDRWSFLRSIQTLREVQNGQVWLAGKLAASTVLWVRGDGSEYATDPEIWRDIRRGRLSLHRITLQAGGSLPAHRTPRPAVELNWFAGYYADSELAPWLRASTAYGLSRWPNFGVIRPLPSQLRMTAMLAEAPQLLSDIAIRGRIPLTEAIRTLNALSACDLLVDQADSRSAVRPNRLEGIAVPAAGFKAFFHSVRRRLGLSVPS
jgi:hypothetical protein